MGGLVIWLVDCSVEWLVGRLALARALTRKRTHGEAGGDKQVHEMCSYGNTSEQMVGWLIGRLVGWFVGWLVLIGAFPKSKTHSPGTGDYMKCSPTELPLYQQFGWLIGRLFVCLVSARSLNRKRTHGARAFTRNVLLGNNH